MAMLKRRDLVGSKGAPESLSRVRQRLREVKNSTGFNNSSFDREHLAEMIRSSRRSFREYLKGTKSKEQLIEKYKQVGFDYGSELWLLEWYRKTVESYSGKDPRVSELKTELLNAMREGARERVQYTHSRGGHMHP